MGRWDLEDLQGCTMSTQGEIPARGADFKVQLRPECQS